MSLIIYALGLMSLLAADFAVTKFLDPADIAMWAQVRSLVGIAGVLCTVGLDQVLVRSPQSSARILRIVAIQVPVLAAIVGTVIVALGFLSNWWVAAGLAAGSSGSLIMFQYYRSHYHPAKSQFSQQGWKIAVFAAIAAMIWQGTVWPLDRTVVILLVICVGLAALGAFRWRPSGLHAQDPRPKRAIYAIGSRFMVTSLFLALAIYAEQLVVGRLGTDTQSALYFTHATYFLFPISVANGYFAFKIGPWIRDNHNRFVAQVRDRIWLILVTALIYTAAVNAVGWIGWWVISPQVTGPDPMLVAVFAFACFMRTLYMLPAGYIGIFGRPRLHDLMIAGQVISAILVVGLFWLTYGPVWGLLHAVAIASALNWALRSLVATGTMLMILRDRRIRVAKGLPPT